MNLTSFESEVLNLVKKIPRGKVVTYKYIAKTLGRPKAVRAVGNTLRENTSLIKIPCHRVVKSDGTIGKYRLGLEKKKYLLRNEGIKINSNNKIENLNDFLCKLEP